MNIVVAVRCYQEARHIARFINGYSFADKIVISDGGSTDGSVEIIKAHSLYESKIKLLHFTEQETVDGQTWNPDHSHINFVLNAAREFKPTWIIFDDADCWPTASLRNDARAILEKCMDSHTQANLFRLYLWGDTGNYFPYMNRHFNPDYMSFWAFRPEHLNVRADENIRHGTLVGLEPSHHKICPPYALLHRSWYPDTIKAKVDRYNALGLPMSDPNEFAGRLELLPSWATE